MRPLNSSLRQAVPDGLEEIRTLARTPTGRSTDILAYFGINRIGVKTRQPDPAALFDASESFSPPPF